MANVVRQLRDWLLEKRPFRIKRMGKDADYSSEVGDVLESLPADLAEQLTTLVDELPSHPGDKAAVKEALSEAIARWQENPSGTNNSLVVIGSPVAAVARILTESLSPWVEDHDLPLQLLDWVNRPLDTQKIQSRLQDDLAPEEDNGTSIAIIPDLSWCFLRTAEGLDGIDYLRDGLLSNPYQFWVIGSGQVGFRYLNCVLKLEAHCSQLLLLPRLSGEQLKDWLTPIIEALDVRLDEDSIQERLQTLGEEQLEASSLSTVSVLVEELWASIKSVFRGVKDDALKPLRPDASPGVEWKDYFERLADLSDGVSTVALQLFVKSIYYEEIDSELQRELLDAVESTEDSVEDYIDFEPPPPHRIIAKLPKLPRLPQLEQTDLYVLYSLLVHGSLTLTALAETLGEERQLVNDAVQIMRGKGIIEQQQNTVKVNPAHYPRLKRKLASNNFII
ncbi:MAG: helix-turn-helix domain-containing protein [Cyanobacteria bacterium P01_A01_bin.135]